MNNNLNKYELLNPSQREAVKHTKGPLLLLAGAGSGKTRVLTHRVAYLIEEEGVKPWNIMAITFTNKAAKEMKERVEQLVGSADVWVSTFHSSCVRILRRHIDLIGYDKSFTIYDTDDAKRLIRECMKTLKIDPKNFKESSVLSTISSAKNQLQDPLAFRLAHQGEMRGEVYAKIYDMYQTKLKKNNALDFDDLLVKTVDLFKFHPEVLETFQDKFQYIMVDEYQDTNGVQFALVSQLARKHRNLCVVGDDDQSIYGFRGADIRNILDFEKVFPDAKVIKLEQNYRSTKHILDAANTVIGHNKKRKVKALWSDGEQGELITVKQCQTDKEEAMFISDKIEESMKNFDRKYADHAILYRTNAQSRILEERLVAQNIPYRIFGGINFYSRKEIKDILAYLRMINNSTDDIAIKRIINEPKRGIGLSTIDRIAVIADAADISFYEAATHVEEFPDLSRASKKVKAFIQMMQTLKTELSTMKLVEFMQVLLERTGYIKELEVEDTIESLGRIENIGELVSKLADYEANAEEPSLSGFLEEVSLVADIDNLSADADVVVLMTLHSAKGLEFPVVFLTGLEEGVFPSYMTLNSGNEEDVEEERRLCYVGITRAETKLYMTSAKQRMINGTTQFNRPSRFLGEVPVELCMTDEGLIGVKASLTDHSVAPSRRDKSFFKNIPYQLHKENASPLPVRGDISLEYSVGDLVKHAKFGVGQVKIIEPGGADYQVTVNFPSSGVKKLIAGLSGLKKM